MAIGFEPFDACVEHAWTEQAWADQFPELGIEPFNADPAELEEAWRLR